jgi:hypothetical protein
MVNNKFLEQFYVITSRRNEENAQQPLVNTVYSSRIILRLFSNWDTRPGRLLTINPASAEAEMVGWRVLMAALLAAVSTHAQSLSDTVR